MGQAGGWKTVRIRAEQHAAISARLADGESVSGWLEAVVAGALDGSSTLRPSVVAVDLVAEARAQGEERRARLAAVAARRHLPTCGCAVCVGPREARRA